MAKRIRCAKVTLSVPLYACGFDPLDSTKLIVGGGGGPLKSGVGNKIISLDTSNPDELQVAAEIELSKDEDNPTCLGVGLGHLIYAGLNSSPRDIEEGKNCHFRVYEIHSVSEEINEKEFARLKILERSKYSLFSKIEKDIYQRIIRLAKPYSDQKQLGAVATGLAKTNENEIVLFKTNGYDLPNIQELLLVEKEAVDIDLIQYGVDEFLFAYCDEYAVYIKNVTPEKDDEKPACIYLISASQSNDKLKNSIIRAIRWLTKDYIIMLINLHGNSGVVLQIISVPPRGDNRIQAQVSQSIRLTHRLHKATGLCIADLTPIKEVMDFQKHSQFVIAVAGHNRSLLLFTVEMKVKAGIYNLSSITPFRTFENVHPLQITCLTFSSIVSPNPSMEENTRQQVLRLASVGISNTVVVQTLPLFSVSSSFDRSSSEIYRYVVTSPPRKTTKGILMGLGVIVIVFFAIFIQTILGTKSNLHTFFNIRERTLLLWQKAPRTRDRNLHTNYI